ncbi:hypothetical protein PHAVU_009G028100 [Phaseolus vulgaris]|uniref:Uncharacterized protein n=1 Tax=Phaseolus vulgaris TaxID=3885 RepID=V7ASE3_PHAVU|nr:hypothetical protein PHAVU_009G028100g [Phaseolus vulgaris]ESW08210.1 hypothetical protein PHAVU_009G028100g [Phaseolus vulgaris]
MEVQARPGNESGYSRGQLAPPQRPELFPLHNHISNSTVVWNYRPSSHINSSAPDAYGAQYAANFTQYYSIPLLLLILFD